jgi:hypothetical protein
VFAALQYNDPDPYLWMPIYLLVDKTGVLNWAGEHHSENIVQSMKAEKPWIEETREFFGLVIVMAVLVINMLWLRKKRIVKL